MKFAQRHPLGHMLFEAEEVMIGDRSFVLMYDWLGSGLGSVPDSMLERQRAMEVFVQDTGLEGVLVKTYVPIQQWRSKLGPFKYTTDGLVFVRANRKRFHDHDNDYLQKERDQHYGRDLCNVKLSHLYRAKDVRSIAIAQFVAHLCLNFVLKPTILERCLSECMARPITGIETAITMIDIIGEKSWYMERVTNYMTVAHLRALSMHKGLDSRSRSMFMNEIERRGPSSVLSALKSETRVSDFRLEAKRHVTEFAVIKAEEHPERYLSHNQRWEPGKYVVSERTDGARCFVVCGCEGNVWWLRSRTESCFAPKVRTIYTLND